MRHLDALPGPLRVFAEPHEMWMAAACIATGVPAAAGATKPQSLVLQLQPWLLHAWGVALCVGGIATVVARWRIGGRQTDLAFRSARALEVLGQTILATALGVYALAILAVGLTGLPGGSIVAAAAGATGIRAWIVARELKRERQQSGPDG